jgi:ribosome biogenesis GTPase
LQLDKLGWNDFFQASFEPHAERGLVPGRVLVEHRATYEVATASGEVKAELAGRLRHQARGREDLPAVGDWVALEGARIHAVLARRTCFVRKSAGGAVDAQIVAANVDSVFLLMSLNADWSERRLERYLTVAWESGAAPVLVLTKADLSLELDARKEEVAGRGVPVHAVSAVSGRGIDELRSYFEGNRTVALLGSSGVGKSTLVNALLGEDRQTVQPIREDDTGKHTTTRREVVLLPAGGLIVDTPGMRELQLWEGERGIDMAFAEIEAIAPRCRFGDCSHEVEPGCAVREAIERGEIPEEKLESLRKLRRELRHVARKQTVRARLEARGGRKGTVKGPRGRVEDEELE